MKKRILLSLVSFFMMTAMWANIIDAYRIEVSASGAGKTYGTAVLTLTMKNRNAISTWQTTLVLPEGVTFKSVTPAGGRYPEGYNPVINATPSNGDNSVVLFCEGEDGFALTGTDGTVATVEVEIAGNAPLGDCTVIVKDTRLVEIVNGKETIHDNPNAKELTWTIEEGEPVGTPGDLNGDGNIDIADAVMVLNIMASGEENPAADLNGDGAIDIADLVMVLNLMAQQ